METMILPRKEMKATLEFQLHLLRRHLTTYTPNTSRYDTMLSTIHAFETAIAFYTRYEIQGN